MISIYQWRTVVAFGERERERELAVPCAPLRINFTEGVQREWRVDETLNKLMQEKERETFVTKAGTGSDIN